MRRSWLLAALLSVAGCNDAICTRQTDCAAGEMCSTLGMCEAAVERHDAATDGVTTDAYADATPDAAIDAPPIDAAVPDATPIDAL